MPISVLGYSLAQAGKTIMCVRFRCRNRPKSELFIVSLELADSRHRQNLFAWECMTSIIFLISLNAQKAMRNFSMASSGMASLSALLHVITITVDICVLLKYTLHYKSWMTKRKIIICIFTIWCLAAIITSTQFWFPGNIWAERNHWLGLYYWYDNS